MSNPNKIGSNFAYGADVGWLSQLEDQGVIWLDHEGEPKDALQILRDFGIDSIRLRVFVNPPSSFQWKKNNGVTCYLGYTDTHSLLKMAQRANGMGFRIMVDIHYSDHFADPEYQDIPEAWLTHSFSELVQDVYNHTHDVMSKLVDLGIYPEWVQVGNEINSGILLPHGASNDNNFSHLTELLNSGYDAVKSVNEASKVVTHLADGHNNATFRWFFDNFLKHHGGKTDVIGFSYYPYWIGTDYKENMDALKNNLNDVASSYHKEVMVCEVGGYDSDETNTYHLLRATINAVKCVPGGRGSGVFYWEPEANASVLPDGYPLGASREISPKVLKISKAMKAFRDSQLDD